MAPAACPVCGARHAACGWSDAQPVDIIRGGPPMPDPDAQPEQLQNYDVQTSSGTPYTVSMTPSDARKAGIIPGDDEARKADASGEQADPAVQPADQSDADAKARQDASNKARSSSSTK